MIHAILQSEIFLIFLSFLIVSSVLMENLSINTVNKTNNKIFSSQTHYKYSVYVDLIVNLAKHNKNCINYK